MMNNKGIVTSGQIFILLFTSNIITAVIYSPVISNINSLWDLLLPVIISMCLSLALLIPVLYMFKRNRYMSISEYSNRLFGKAGNIVTIFYAIYFCVNVIYYLSIYYLFLKNIAPKNIQIWMIICVLIIACIYASFKGIEAISRLSGIVFISVLTCIIIIAAFLFPSITNNNFLPIDYISFNTTVEAIIFIMSRMNSIVILIMLYPITKGNIIRGSFLWIISFFLFSIMIILISTGALGEYLNIQMFPIYHSIDGNGTLQRLNPVFLAVITAGIFCEISMLMYIISQCVKNISNENKGKKFTIISGITVVIICLILSNNNNYINILFNSTLNLILTLIFSVLIPVIILTINKIKKNNRNFVNAKNVLRTISLTIIISIICITFSGCNTIQLNQRIIVQGIGVDILDDNKYKVTLITLDTENEENENEIKLIYTEGRNIEQAFSLLEIRNGKELLFNQCLFIMLNENITKDIDYSLEYFLNNNDILKNVNLMICENSAENIISTAIKEFNYKSSDINALADSKTSNQSVIQCSLLDYISFKNNQYDGIIMPYININPEISSIQNNRSIIINNNDQINYLSNNESNIILMINNKLKEYTGTLYNIENQEIEYKIKIISSKIVPKIISNHLSLDINLNSLILKKENIDEMLIYNDLYEEMQSTTIKLINNYCCDIFLINKSIQLQYPNFYKTVKNWNNLLKNADITINITYNHNSRD